MRWHISFAAVDPALIDCGFGPHGKTSLRRVLNAGGDSMQNRSRATDRLFFAVFSDPASARRVASLGEELRCRHGLTGKMLARERLHVTLCHVGDYVGLAAAIAAEASKVAATVHRPAFTVAFKSAMSFRGRPSNHPFVLCGDDGVIGVTMLQQALGEAMQKAGLDCGARHHTPHVTLMYGDRFVAEQTLEGEVSWAVREFVLVHSLLGRSRYRCLSRFPLG